MFKSGVFSLNTRNYYLENLTFMEVRCSCFQCHAWFLTNTGKSLAVCRGTWFTGSGAAETWQPVNEEDAEQIEMSHQSMWRAMVSRF